MGDQVIPTNDALRESDGELGDWLTAGGCRHARRENVFVEKTGITEHS